MRSFCGAGVGAEVLGTAAGVAAGLTDYDPCAPVRGYPPGDTYAQKQRRLLRDVRARYEAQVSELLAAHPEFAEGAD